MSDKTAFTPELPRKTLLIAFAATLGMMTSSPPIVSGPQGLLLVSITHAFGIGRGTLALMSGVSLLLGAAVVMGLGQRSETGLASYYVSRFCGLRAYASIFAMVMMLVTLSACVFPTIAGYVYDRTGSYDALMPFMVVVLAAPALAIAFMPGYRFKAATDTGPAAH